MRNGNENRPLKGPLRSTPQVPLGAFRSTASRRRYGFCPSLSLKVIFDNHPHTRMRRAHCIPTQLTSTGVICQVTCRGGVLRQEQTSLSRTLRDRRWGGICFTATARSLCGETLVAVTVEIFHHRLLSSQLSHGLNHEICEAFHGENVSMKIMNKHQYLIGIENSAPLSLDIPLCPHSECIISKPLIICRRTIPLPPRVLWHLF